MCIISDSEQQVGKIINLTVYFPNAEEKVNIHCKIVWSRDVSEHMYKTGLEFWNLTDDAEIRIREQMETNKLAVALG
jgi:Tfp pilus assembly protein PilZ